MVVIQLVIYDIPIATTIIPCIWCLRPQISLYLVLAPQSYYRKHSYLLFFCHLPSKEYKLYSLYVGLQISKPLVDYSHMVMCDIILQVHKQTGKGKCKVILGPAVHTLRVCPAGKKKQCCGKKKQCCAYSMSTL